MWQPERPNHSDTLYLKNGLYNTLYNTESFMDTSHILRFEKLTGFAEREEDAGLTTLAKCPRNLTVLLDRSSGISFLHDVFELFRFFFSNLDRKMLNTSTPSSNLTPISALALLTCYKSVGPE